MNRHFGIHGFGLSLLIACTGSETGNPVEDEHTNEGGGECKAVSRQQLDLAATSSLGFSANDVLAFAGGSHTDALRWQTLRFGSYAPESGQQSFDVRVTPANQRANLVHYVPAGNAEIGGQCDDALEVDVDLELISGGGALNESIRSKLVAIRAESATIYARLDPAKLEGTLTVSADGLGEGWKVPSLNVGVQFTRYGISGSLTASFEQSTRDSTSSAASPGPLAIFGLAPCDYGLAVPLSATGAASSSAAMMAIAQRSAVTVNGSSATLTFTPVDRACQLFASDRYVPRPGPALLIPGTLALTTEDGSLDARWPVVVRSAPDANGQPAGPVEVELDQSTPPAAGSLAERYGILQVDTAGYDSTSVSAQFSLSSSGWQGAAIVYGFINANCPAPTPGANGSPGCPGAERKELARFELR